MKTRTPKTTNHFKLIPNKKQNPTKNPVAAGSPGPGR
jgi:hypothetical protein